MPTEVRRARPEDADAVTRLLYLSAAGMYDRYAGDRDAAMELLRRAYARPGTNASAEISWVAEAERRIAGALAGFPLREGARRARAFLLVTLRSLPPSRWPAALRLYRLGARLTPPAPRDAFYVDGLATAPDLRRRGAGRALLQAAEAHARSLGLPVLALDTSLDNAAARSLYEGFGFQPTGEVAPSHGLPGFVGYVKRVS